MISLIAQSDTYGTFAMELVAYWDLRSFPSDARRNLQMGDMTDSNLPQALKANTEFRKFSPCYDLVSLPHARDREGDSTFAIYCPIDDMNADWFSNNPDCEYVQSVKRNGGKVKKIFPIAAKRAKWAKFLDKYPMMKIPENILSIDDLKLYVNEHPSDPTPL